MPKVAVSAHRSAVLQSRAHGLRGSQTLSERKLWEALSGGKLGIAFRRQVPLAGWYIADFFAPALRLVVEVDGALTSIGAAPMLGAMRSFGGSGIACCGLRRSS